MRPLTSSFEAGKELQHDLLLSLALVDHVRVGLGIVPQPHVLYVQLPAAVCIHGREDSESY